MNPLFLMRITVGSLSLSLRAPSFIRFIFSLFRNRRRYRFEVRPERSPTCFLPVYACLSDRRVSRSFLLRDRDIVRASSRYQIGVTIIESSRYFRSHSRSSRIVTGHSQRSGKISTNGLSLSLPDKLPISSRRVKTSQRSVYIRSPVAAHYSLLND